MRVPFIVYTDFESFTPQLPHANQTQMGATKSGIRNTPCGFCYHIKCFDDTLYSQEPVIFIKEYDDDDVAQIFIDTLEKNIKDIYKKFKFPKVW